MPRKPEPPDTQFAKSRQPPISDVRIQCHREESGLWRVTVSGFAGGAYRREDYRDVEFLRIAVGQLLAGFGRRHGGEPL